MTAPDAEQRRPGRPSLFTDDRRQRVVDAVRVGNYLKVAAAWAGVGERTLMTWLARGRDAQAQVDAHDETLAYCPGCGAEQGPLDGPLPSDYRCGTCGTDQPPGPWALDPDAEEYRQFLQEVTRAEHSAEVAAVTAWREAFGTDWRAARDYLVRRRPDRWAATTRISMTTEEAERRIDGALAEAMAALAGDSDELPGHDDLAAALDEALAGDTDTDTDDEGGDDA